MVHKEIRFKNLEEYTAYRVRKDWNMSMEEAEKKAMDDLMKGLEPYDRTRFGDLPKVLNQ